MEPRRQKQWANIKALIKEHMDFRTSRLPPGTYANMVASAQAAAALSRARSGSAKNKDGAGKGGNRPAVEDAVILPGMQDGKESHRASHTFISLCKHF